MNVARLAYLRRRDKGQFYFPDNLVKATWRSDGPRQVLLESTTEFIVDFARDSINTFQKLLRPYLAAVRESRYLEASDTWPETL